MTAPPPDLSSILQTLSAYTYHPQLHNQPAVPQAEEAEYDPSQYDPSLTIALQSHHQPQNTSHSVYPPTSSAPETQWHTPPTTPQPPAIETPKPPQPPPIPSIRSITTYAAALRHITTHLLPLPHFTSRIQHLIHTQHKHERQWHVGRETLVKQLQNRDASRKKLEEVLATIGGGMAGGGGGGKDATTGEMSKEEELRMYDRKVWRAQREMVEAAERELGRLGVPFFKGEDGGSRWEGEEGREEKLRGLRGEVAKLLGDLCGREGEGDG